MSRCFLKSKDEKTIAIGIEDECWFIQVFKENPVTREDEFDLDVDCSKVELLSHIGKYADMEDPYVVKVIECIMLDIDPNQIDLDSNQANLDLMLAVEKLAEALVVEREELS